MEARVRKEVVKLLLTTQMMNTALIAGRMTTVEDLSNPHNQAISRFKKTNVGGFIRAGSPKETPTEIPRRLFFAKALRTAETNELRQTSLVVSFGAKSDVKIGEEDPNPIVDPGCHEVLVELTQQRGSTRPSISPSISCL